MRSAALPGPMAGSSSSSIATSGHRPSFQVFASLLSSRSIDLKLVGQLRVPEIGVRFFSRNHVLVASASPFRCGPVRSSINGSGESPSCSGSPLPPAEKFRATVSTLSASIFPIRKRIPPRSLAALISIVAAVLLFAVRFFIARKSRYKPRSGTVADLVRRGQLKHDSRGISSPLNYDDPFNNPFVKIREANSTIEVCGKRYKLAPVTLTKEEQADHQRRRSRAYQWKRPTVFLKEGDPIPPDVDPDTVRWIPANHPFATTASDIDEGLAQTNVFQKDGVPYRIKAEHEALQRKHEALQNVENDGNSGYFKDYGRQFKMNPMESGERISSDDSPPDRLQKP